MKALDTRRRLGDLFAFKNGRAFKKEEWCSEGLPIIRIQNLNNENGSFNYYAGEYSDDILVHDGDLLFSWSGTVGSSFGPHLWQGGEGLLNQHIFAVSFKTEMDKRYAYYALEEITEEIEQQVSGAVGLVHITKEKLNDFTIPAPPVPEQQRIVGILDQAFDGIAKARANAEKNLQNARALFESHLQSVFTQRGKGWVEKRLGEFVLSVSTGPFGSLLHKSDYVSEGVPLVNPINIVDSSIVPNESKQIDPATKKRLQSYILKEGDIVIGRRGEIGRCAVVGHKEDGWICGTGCFFIRPLPTVNAQFLANLIRSGDYREQLERASTGATMKNLSNKALGDLVIAMPSLQVQASILAKLDALTEETQRLESLYQRKLAALDELKKSLLHQAFSGAL